MMSMGLPNPLGLSTPGGRSVGSLAVGGLIAADEAQPPATSAASTIDAPNRQPRSHIPASVDGDGLPGHVLRLVAGQEADGVGDVARRGHATERHLVNVFLIDALGRPAGAPAPRLLAAELVHPVAGHD